MLLLMAPGVALAGPFPPVASATASPGEPAVGEAVQFSADGTFDPDDANDVLTYEWDFDDGELGVGSVLVSCAGSGEIVALHVASRAVVKRRRVGVRVEGLVTLGDDRVLAAVPSESAAVLLEPDLGELSRVAVGGEPRTVARDGENSVAFVASSHYVTDEQRRVRGSYAAECSMLFIPRALTAMMVPAAVALSFTGGRSSLRFRKGLSRSRSSRSLGYRSPSRIELAGGWRRSSWRSPRWSPSRPGPGGQNSTSTRRE